MLVSDVRGVLARHWPFVLGGILATVTLCVAIMLVIPVRYEAKAMVVLLPPRSTEGTGGNPYLDLGGLDTAAAVLGRAMGTTEIADRVARTSSTATFVVEGDPSTSGPVLLVTADDRQPARALDTLAAVLKEVGPKMTELQLASGAPTQTLISVAVVTQDVQATTVRKTQLRALVAAATIGFGLTVLGASMLERRRARRQAGVVNAMLPAPASTTVLPVQAPRVQPPRVPPRMQAPPVSPVQGQGPPVQSPPVPVPPVPPVPPVQGPPVPVPPVQAPIPIVVDQSDDAPADEDQVVAYPPPRAHHPPTPRTSQGPVPSQAVRPTSPAGGAAAPRRRPSPRLRNGPVAPDGTTSGVGSGSRAPTETT